MGLFHTHKWVYVESDHYQKKYPFNKGASDVTLVLRRCEECGEVRTEEIDGLWSKEALNGRR